MNFFVYERDPLIRDDIVETIKEAFSGVVHIIEDLNELGEDLTLSVLEPIMILSVSGRDMIRKKAKLLSFAGATPVVVICDDLPVNDRECSSAYFVQRPFNSPILLSAIKNARSFPRTDPS